MKGIVNTALEIWRSWHCQKWPASPIWKNGDVDRPHSQIECAVLWVSGCNGNMSLTEKDDLVLLFLKYLPSQTQPAKCKISLRVCQRTPNKKICFPRSRPPSIFRHKGRKWSHSNDHFRHWRTQKLARTTEMLHVHRHFLGGQVVRITIVKPFPRKSSHDLSREQRKRAWIATEYPPSGPKAAPIQRLEVLLSYEWRGRRRQAHSCNNETIVLSTFVRVFDWLGMIAVAISMRIEAFNGTGPAASQLQVQVSAKVQSDTSFLEIVGSCGSSIVDIVGRKWISRGRSGSSWSASITSNHGFVSIFSCASIACWPGGSVLPVLAFCETVSTRRECHKALGGTRRGRPLCRHRTSWSHAWGVGGGNSSCWVRQHEAHRPPESSSADLGQSWSPLRFWWPWGGPPCSL